MLPYVSVASPGGEYLQVSITEKAEMPADAFRIE